MTDLEQKILEAIKGEPDEDILLALSMILSAAATAFADGDRHKAGDLFLRLGNSMQKGDDAPHQMH